jgi:hypothetical protein
MTPNTRPTLRGDVRGVNAQAQFPILTNALTVDPAQASGSSTGFERAVSSAVLVFPGG